MFHILTQMDSSPHYKSNVKRMHGNYQCTPDFRYAIIWLHTLELQKQEIKVEVL